MMKINCTTCPAQMIYFCCITIDSSPFPTSDQISWLDHIKENLLMRFLGQHLQNYSISQCQRHFALKNAQFWRKKKKKTLTRQLLRNENADTSFVFLEPLQRLNQDGSEWDIMTVLLSIWVMSKHFQHTPVFFIFYHLVILS